MYTINYSVADYGIDDEGRAHELNVDLDTGDDDQDEPGYTEFYAELVDENDETLAEASEEMPWDGEHDVRAAFEGCEVWDRLAEAVMAKVEPGFTGRVTSTCNVGNEIDIYFADGKAKCETEI